ncbi:MAG: GNAT family N-acetyltransferase [Phycisphaerae bacterium]|mgnify:CR=1 FL=1|nr:GNAT family N-acetyltransferase [Phycisphaerae bacterium]
MATEQRKHGDDVSTGGGPSGVGMRIVTLRHNSPELAEVKALCRQNSGTLGFLPEGAFDEYASKQQLLAAVAPDGALTGYLLYRIAGERVGIIHLCVDKTQREGGIARSLFERLRQSTQEYDGVFLHCRRDYGLASFWGSLGFVPIAEKPGRGKDGGELIFWWYDYDKPSLFSLIDERATEARMPVVLDANALYDLQDPSSSKTEESRALLADWLQAVVELCITNETYHEINRAPSPTERKRRRAFAQQFPLVKAVSEAVAERVQAEVARLLPGSSKPQDLSDIRQLAEAVAAGSSFFVTRDERILGKRKLAFDRLGIRIFRPCELILHLDEEREEASYLPARLAGSHIRISRITHEQIRAMEEAYYDPLRDEDRAVFRQRLREYLSHPDRYEFWGVSSAEELVAVVSYDGATPNSVEVPVLRVKTGMAPRDLAMYLVLNAMTRATREGKRFVRIGEPVLPEGLAAGLLKTGFVPSEGRWVKLVLPAAAPRDQIVARIRDIASEEIEDAGLLRTLATLVEQIPLNSHPRSLVSVERSLFPAKLSDLAIPSFVVPIRPQWAMHLFDEHLASQDLYGSDPHLVLSAQNVYYRAARPRILTAPARLLWYVSEDSGYPGTKAIRAVSYIERVETGPPKELFRRFRKLGVYEWRHVYELARRHTDNQVMAFVFSHTELLPKPVPLKVFKSVLMDCEQRSNNLQSPVLINGQTFVRLYQIGYGKE